MVILSERPTAIKALRHDSSEESVVEQLQKEDQDFEEDGEEGTGYSEDTGPDGSDAAEAIESHRPQNNASNGKYLSWPFVPSTLHFHSPLHSLPVPPPRSSGLFGASKFAPTSSFVIQARDRLFFAGVPDALRGLKLTKGKQQHSNLA